MERLWKAVKESCRDYAIFCGCFWLMVWIVGSFHAGRTLRFNELIPTADRWIAWWR